MAGLVCGGGCEVTAEEEGAKEDGGRLSVATWNIQALFDGEETGTEYEDYRGAAGWSGEKYRARLTAISRGVIRMADRAPDILALEETENLQVLEDLARGELSKQGYNWTFFARNPGGALGIGVLSRFPFTLSRAHSLSAGGETAPRPVLELWIEPRGKPLALFVCHWKSKLGGEEATESLRRASARILLRRLGEIRRDYPGTPVLIMGDLNENHDEFYRRAGTALSALLPDDPKAAELAGLAAGGEGAGDPAILQKDFLVLSRKKPPESVHFRAGTTVLYTPWGGELTGGSYNYKGAWETIDHFLMNAPLFDGEGWDFESCRVAEGEPFTNAKGYPNAYNPRNGAGLSDHLPLLLSLIWHGAAR
jgi:endonuclease/exonuclease/phosphatase family metal-dependent hydrolase